MPFRNPPDLTALPDVLGPFGDGEAPVYDSASGLFLPVAVGGGGAARIARVLFDTGVGVDNGQALSVGSFLEDYRILEDDTSLIALIDSGDIMLNESGFYRLSAYWTVFVASAGAGTASFSSLLAVYGTYFSVSQPAWTTTFAGAVTGVYVTGRADLYTNIEGDPGGTFSEVIELEVARVEGESGGFGTVVDQANSQIYGNYDVMTWDAPGEQTYIDIERLGDLR